MRGALISLGSVSSQMTAEAMVRYFDHVDMINLKELEVRLGKEGGIYYKGKALEDYDCVYVKGSFRYAQLLRSISSILEGKVAYLPLPASSFTTVHDKLLTHLALEQQGIPMPRTYVTATIESAKELLQKVNYPIVMKFPQGTQGKGVVFADSISSASSLLDALGALNQAFIIQEYVETGGTDLRVLVVGDRAIAGMRRKAKTDEKRSNLHAGGAGEAVLDIPREVQNVAIRTARALEADVCGVDILESPLGPLVIEANISPGLQGITAATSIDIAGEIAKFFYQKTQKILEQQKAKHSSQVMQELQLDSSEKQEATSQELITTLKMRAERVVLPALVTQVTGFNDLDNYRIKVSKDRLEIEKFDL